MAILVTPQGYGCKAADAGANQMLEIAILLLEVLRTQEHALLPDHAVRPCHAVMAFPGQL